MEKKVLLLAFVVLCISCAFGGCSGNLEDDSVQSAIKLYDVNPLIIDGESGIRVYIRVYNDADTVTSQSIPVSINLLDRHRHPMGIYLESPLNPEHTPIPSDSYYENYLFAPLPDSILQRGGTIYLDMTLDGIPQERIQFNYILFTGE